MFAADEVTVKKQEEKIGAENMIAANKVTVTQQKDLKTDLKRSKKMEAASIAVQLVMKDKLGEPVSENIVAVALEQEAAEDIVSWRRLRRSPRPGQSRSPSRTSFSWPSARTQWPCARRRRSSRTSGGSQPLRCLSGSRPRQGSRWWT